MEEEEEEGDVEEVEEAEDEEEFLEPTLSSIPDNLSRPSAPPRTRKSMATYSSHPSKAIRRLSANTPSAKEPVYYGKSLEW